MNTLLWITLIIVLSPIIVMAGFIVLVLLTLILAGIILLPIITVITIVEKIQDVIKKRRSAYDRMPKNK